MSGLECGGISRLVPVWGEDVRNTEGPFLA